MMWLAELCQSLPRSQLALRLAVQLLRGRVPPEAVGGWATLGAGAGVGCTGGAAGRAMGTSAVGAVGGAIDIAMVAGCTGSASATRRNG